MAFCSNCGQPIPEGGKFCASCGTPVAVVPAVQPEPEPVQPVVQVQPEPEPVQQYAPGTMIGLDVDDLDMESGVEPKPIVGTYVASAGPVAQQMPQQRAVQSAAPQQRAAQPVPPRQRAVQSATPQQRAAQPVPPRQRAAQSAAPQQRVAQPVQAQQQAAKPRPAKQGNRKLLPIILGIAGGVLTLVLIIVAAVLIAGRSGSKAAGEGTALVDMLDDAAYNKEIEYGYGYDE